MEPSRLLAYLGVFPDNMLGWPVLGHRETSIVRGSDDRIFAASKLDSSEHPKLTQVDPVQLPGDRQRHLSRPNDQHSDLSSQGLDRVRNHWRYCAS